MCVVDAYTLISGATNQDDTVDAAQRYQSCIEMLMYLAQRYLKGARLVPLGDGEELTIGLGANQTLMYKYI